MSRRLILMRHAKSSWDDPRLADHDRMLNSRGIRAAGLIGRWLAAKGHVPGEALVSAAARTQETWTRVAAALAGAGEAPAAGIPARSEVRLYHADPDTMLKVLRTAQAPVVALIGHNPGIAEFAARLLRREPDHREFRRYPTAATLVADFPIDDWAALVPSSGDAVDFVVPRELE